MRVAHNCPSGAITYERHDEGPNEAPPAVNVVRVRENEDLARVISEKMRKLPGITGSETLISFKVYSKQDLDAGFQLGLD